MKKFHANVCPTGLASQSDPSTEVVYEQPDSCLAIGRDCGHKAPRDLPGRVNGELGKLKRRYDKHGKEDPNGTFDKDGDHFYIDSGNRTPCSRKRMDKDDEDFLTGIEHFTTGAAILHGLVFPPAAALFAWASKAERDNLRKKLNISSRQRNKQDLWAQDPEERKRLIAHVKEMNRLRDEVVYESGNRQPSAGTSSQ